MRCLTFWIYCTVSLDDEKLGIWNSILICWNWKRATSDAAQQINPSESEHRNTLKKLAKFWLPDIISKAPLDWSFLINAELQFKFVNSWTRVHASVNNTSARLLYSKNTASGVRQRLSAPENKSQCRILEKCITCELRNTSIIRNTIKRKYVLKSNGFQLAGCCWNHQSIFKHNGNTEQ